LSLPDPKQGKELSSATDQLMISFYHYEELKKEMPGKKDSLSIDCCQHKQKCFLLCNDNELFAVFKLKRSEVKLGFSKFYSVRPKWRILAGAVGTHSVCVCVMHQNMKLLLAPVRLDYIDLIRYLQYLPKVPGTLSKNYEKL